MQRFMVTVEFKSVRRFVVAKNATAAKQKVYDTLAKKPAVRLAVKNKTDVQEI